MNRRQRLIERGYGYWCYEVLEPVEIGTAPADGEMGAESVDIDTQLVYRPVMVDTNDDGEAYAYYYDAESNTRELLERGWKRYVPLDQVYGSPLNGAEPAYRYAGGP